VAETPPAETAAPVESGPAATEPVPAEPVAVKTPRPGSGVAYTTVDMSLRAGPSAHEEPITVVPAGSRVVLTGVMEGGFQRVTYKEEIGWIADEYLETPADRESNLDPYAVNPSGSYGLFQFIRSTWKSTPFGNKDIFDPEANANAAAWMWSEGRKSEWVCQ
jgi:hypothetical protein